MSRLTDWSGLTVWEGAAEDVEASARIQGVDGHITRVGIRTTLDAARQWEQEQRDRRAGSAIATVALVPERGAQQSFPGPMQHMARLAYHTQLLFASV